VSTDERKIALEHTEWSDVKVNFSKYKALQIERDGPVLRVWFDRPDQLNAVSRDVHGELGRCSSISTGTKPPEWPSSAGAGGLSLPAAIWTGWSS
jgi:hypothetical protein